MNDGPRNKEPINMDAADLMRHRCYEVASRFTVSAEKAGTHTEM